DVTRLARLAELEALGVDLELVEFEDHRPMMPARPGSCRFSRVPPPRLQDLQVAIPHRRAWTSTPRRRRAMATVTEPVARNGVDVPNLFGTINAVGAQPELAQFRFRATNRWVAGTHSRTTIEQFSGAGGEHSHVETYAYDADHPAVLVGRDQAPTPVEFLLH